MMKSNMNERQNIKAGREAENNWCFQYLRCISYARNSVVHEKEFLKYAPL